MTSEPVKGIVTLEQQAPPFFTACISRETGSRGRTIGNVVARKMGWTLYDQELLEYIARVEHAREEVFEQLRPEARQWVLAWRDAILTDEARHEDYIRRLVQVVLSVAMTGKAVFVGRGACFIVPRSRCVSVRVIGSRENRIAYLCQRERMSPEAAEQYIDKTDEQRTEFVRRYFGREPQDPHHYDLIVDGGSLGEELCGELIVAAIHGKQLYQEDRARRQTRPSPVPDATTEGA